MANYRDPTLELESLTRGFAGPGDGARRSVIPAKRRERVKGVPFRTLANEQASEDAATLADLDNTTAQARNAGSAVPRAVQEEECRHWPRAAWCEGRQAESAPSHRRQTDVTKKSTETFRQLCEHLTKDPRLSAACQKIGLSQTQLYRWLAESQQGNLEFAFHFLDDRNATALHVAIRQAQTIFHQTLVSEAENVSMHGRWVATFYKGQRQFERDPALDIYSDDELQAMGKDRYKRDENGEFVPVLAWEPPPAQLLLAVLQARAPRIYGQKVHHTVDQKINLGVTVVQPPKITPPAPVTVVTPPPALPSPDIEDGEYTETTEPDLSFLDLTDDTPPPRNPDVNRER